MHILLFFCIAMTLVVVGCSGGSPVDPADANLITSEYYIQATIDGEVATYEELESADTVIELSIGTHYRPHHPAGALIRQTSELLRWVTPPVDTTNLMVADTSYRSLRVSFVKYFHETPQSAHGHGPLISLGAAEYGSFVDWVDGVEISWRDRYGKEWSTAYAPADQTTGSFMVTGYERDTTDQPMNGSFYKVTGTFDCTLYDSYGHGIAVTDGRFSVRSIHD